MPSQAGQRTRRVAAAPRYWTKDGATGGGLARHAKKVLKIFLKLFFLY
jgi:hypothetical protein